MHQHLDVFGLINMNGRLYDPWVGRMLSPDPYIVEPSNSQNYNRYSYALNNPLKYIDPTGYRPHWYHYEEEYNQTRGGGYNYSIGGHITVGSGYHWSDGMNSDRDYAFMTSSTYDKGYGAGAAASRRFDNFVTSNSVLSASGASAQTIFEGIQSGLSYYSVYANGQNVLVSAYGGLGTSYTSNSGAVGFVNPTAAVHLGAYNVNGSAGGGDLMIDPIGPGSDKYYEPSIMEMITNNKTRQGVSFAVGLESAMLSIATYGNKAKTVKQVASSSNYTGAAFGMADSYLSAQQAIMQGNMNRAQIESLQFILYGAGAAMYTFKDPRISSVGSGIVFVNGLIDLGQYWYDGN